MCDCGRHFRIVALATQNKDERGYKELEFNSADLRGLLLNDALPTHRVACPLLFIVILGALPGILPRGILPPPPGRRARLTPSPGEYFGSPRAASITRRLRLHSFSSCSRMPPQETRCARQVWVLALPEIEAACWGGNATAPNRPTEEPFRIGALMTLQSVRLSRMAAVIG
jgi:hypothetical protein